MDAYFTGTDLWETILAGKEMPLNELRRLERAGQHLGEGRTRAFSELPTGLSHDTRGVQTGQLESFCADIAICHKLPDLNC